MATYDQSGNLIAEGANPRPGAFVMETQPDGSAVFVIGLNPGDSANTLAGFYTMGGMAYGPAVANFNGWDWAPDEAVAGRAQLAVIPAEWMKSSYTATGALARVLASVHDASQAVSQQASDASQVAQDAASRVANVATNIGSAFTNAVNSFGNAGKWIVYGLVALAVIEVLSKVPTKRR